MLHLDSTNLKGRKVCSDVHKHRVSLYGPKYVQHKLDGGVRAGIYKHLVSLYESDYSDWEVRAGIHKHLVILYKSNYSDMWFSQGWYS